MTSRRRFLKTSVLGAGAAALPSIVPSSVLGQNSPSNRVNIALIGCGGRMGGVGLRGVGKLDGARIIAAVDPANPNRPGIVRVPTYVEQW